MRSHLLRYLTLCACLACFQSSTKADSFRILAWGGNLNDLIFKVGKNQIDINVSEIAPSEILPMPVNRKISLLKRGINAEGLPEILTVATFDAPEKIEKGILLVATVGPDKYEGRWFEDKYDPKGPETIRLLNFAGRPVALQINGENHKLNAGEELTYNCPSGIDVVPVLIAQYINGGWRLACNNPYRIHPTVKVVGLIREGRTIDGMLISPLELVSYFEFPPETTTPAP
jgi:hypothetical protein